MMDPATFVLVWGSGLFFGGGLVMFFEAGNRSPFKLLGSAIFLLVGLYMLILALLP